MGSATMGIFEIFKNGNKKEYDRLHGRLDDLEEILHDISFRTDDRMESVLFGIEAVMPEEKGKFINKLEERLTELKRGMVDSVILSSCSGAPKAYPELRKEVRDRTSLNVSAAFLDDRIRHLSYMKRLERVGSRYITDTGARRHIHMPTLVEKTDESAIAKEIMVMVGATPGGAAAPAPSNGTAKLEKLEAVLKAAARLEKGMGAVPVPDLLRETRREGIDDATATGLVDEHLMVTGRLYEPKQGHVKLARPLP